LNPKDHAIILFKGETQYGVLNRFIEDIESAFVKDGQKFVTFDLRHNFESIKQQLVETLNTGQTLFALGINCMGQFFSDNISVYDILKIPHISWLVDHPIHHFSKIDIPYDSKKQISHIPEKFGVIATIDDSHKQFIDITFNQHYGCLFLPHGGCVAKNDIERSRHIDAVFCGTGISPEIYRQKIKEENIEDFRLTEKVVELSSVKNERRNLLELTTKVFTEEQQKPDRKRFIKVMQNAERYWRAKERFRSLKVLDDNRISVNIFGNGWEFADFKIHRIRKALSFEESLEVFQQSKLSLNSSSFFTHGAHERIFSSMLNGAVSITSTSNYLDNLKGFNKVAEVFKTLDELPDRMADSLKKSKILREKSNASKIFARKGHTFGHRALELRDTIWHCLN